MALELWAHADRIAADAARLAPSSARLTDRLARLRLMQGLAETALAIIDACAAPSDSLRQLRVACLVRLGRLTDAHCELLAWTKRAAAPLFARRLLALLEWDAGDRAAALRALRANLRQIDDPGSLEILLLMSAAEGRATRAQACAACLRHAANWNAPALDAGLLLRSLGLRAAPAPAEPRQEEIRTLALELSACESVIPALAAAQRLRFEPLTARLLYAAIIRALPTLAEPSAGHEALAQLAVLLENREAAAGWVERGRRINPMSASLARLAAELSPLEFPAGRDRSDSSAGLRVAEIETESKLAPPAEADAPLPPARRTRRVRAA